MNIGFVSTWLERGATYVTKSYMQLMESSNKLFVYARGGETVHITPDEKKMYNIEVGYRLSGTLVHWSHFCKWIKKNKIEILFFNEQQNFDVVYKSKIKFPNIKIGAYIDYYTDNTVSSFNVYDFLICNTLRHYSVFKWHPQCFYVKWGTFPSIFQNVQDKIDQEKVVFFHSMGLSHRKGTKALLETFIDNKQLHKNSSLIIHTQLSLDIFKEYGDLSVYNIQIISKEVSLPGLYHLGDVYVYPTTLDGLGLTMYEAMMSGLPIIATNEPPMNEVVTGFLGRLIDVDYYKSRADGYYWPLSIISKDSLLNEMLYYINNKTILKKLRSKIKNHAIDEYDLSKRKKIINEIFENTKVIEYNKKELKEKVKQIKSLKRKNTFVVLSQFVPNRVISFIHKRIEIKRYGE